jgi:hypothetical protein
MRGARDGSFMSLACMVIEEPSYDLRQPSSLFGNGLVPALTVLHGSAAWTH